MMEMKVMLLILLLSCNFMFARAAEQPMVFAHYMLYEPDGVETLKKEIELAYSKGIDAFALNSNVWRPDRADDMFQAALDSGTDFKLFFSADMSTNSEGTTLSSDNLTAMLTRYANHSNHLTYNGKLFFSAWLGGSTSWTEIFQAAGGRDKFFFVPFFPTGGTYDEVQKMLSDYNDVIDGLFAWDTSAWPYESSNLNNPPSDSMDQNYLKACNDVGKVYMASPSPWFFKNLPSDSCSSTTCQAKDINQCNCQVKGNYEGPGLWIAKWQQLISLKPPLVQIVTWNDWQESSYIAPPYSAAAKKDGADTFSHVAFLELGEHYIRWYKSGQEPALAEEAVYLFYYTQPKSIRGTSDQGTVLRAENLTDNLYVTTALNSAAEGELSSGGTSKPFSAAVGINTYSMPFQVGHQAAVLKRGSTVVFTVNGTKDIIDSQPERANLNVYSTCTNCTAILNACNVPFRQVKIFTTLHKISTHKREH